MASQQFIIRCETEKGSFTLQDLFSGSTVGELKASLASILNCSPQILRVMSGYPPRALAEGSDAMTLDHVNIHLGETIIVQRLPASIIPDDRILQQAFPHAVDAGAAGDRTIEFEKVLVASAGIMMRKVVPYNNSCLFTSVYYCISNGNMDPDMNTELRRVIVWGVSDNPEKYNEAFLGMSNAEYCKWIMNNDHWGGAIELSILSEYFSIEIVAIDILMLKLHRFGEECYYPNRIFLIYDGIHYDPLNLELQNGGRQTIFPVADGYVMEMALEVAKEARSSDKYTDVANFTLRFNQCDFQLRGDAEA